MRCYCLRSQPSNNGFLCMQVLPHLLEEVRSEQLQQLVLPLVIHILGKQDRQVGRTHIDTFTSHACPTLTTRHSLYSISALSLVTQQACLHLAFLPSVTTLSHCMSAITCLKSTGQSMITGLFTLLDTLLNTLDPLPPRFALSLQTLLIIIIIM